MDLPPEIALDFAVVEPLQFRQKLAQGRLKNQHQGHDHDRCRPSERINNQGNKAERTPPFWLPQGLCSDNRRDHWARWGALVRAEIHVEGGGPPGRHTNIRCREGFRKLLAKCGLDDSRFQVTACGGGGDARNDFLVAHADAGLKLDAERYILGIVDRNRKHRTGSGGRAMRAVVAVAILVFASGAWVRQPASASDRAGVGVFDRDRPLRFDHLCAEPGRSYGAYRQAYAFFEDPAASEGHAALVLANVIVGWIAGQAGPNGVGLRIVKMRMRLPAEWRGARFGLALQIVGADSRRAVTGTLSTKFNHSTGDSYPEEEAYRVSASGEVDWVEFLEPEERVSKETPDYRHSQSIRVDGRDVPATDATLTLNLVVEHERTSSRLVLAGPVLDDLESLLQIERPTPRVLGFFQTLNPFQKGGLWDWLSTGRRYQPCLQARKQAKRAFDLRFGRSVSEPR